MTCFFLSHKWGMDKWDIPGKGCICLKCGKTRHDYSTHYMKKMIGHVCGNCEEVNPNRIIHNFEPVKQYPHTNCKCTVCGKDVHDWDGCICKACGKSRYHREPDKHILESCTCKKCGQVFHIPGQGCSCIRCGAELHDLDDNCCCRKCRTFHHRVRPDSSTCSRCGVEIDLERQSASDTRILHWINELVKMSYEVREDPYGGAKIDESSKARIRAIGEEINQAGGKDLMGKVHEEVRRQRPATSELFSQLWNGIGEWAWGTAEGW